MSFKIHPYTYDTSRIYYIMDEGGQYLHKDGTVHDSAGDVPGWDAPKVHGMLGMGGYYASREEAERTLLNYQPNPTGWNSL